MSFFDKAKAFAKTLDTDKLAQEIQQGTHTIANMGAKAGIINPNLAHQLDTTGQKVGQQLDVFGDKHPEYFGNKPQQGNNPNAPRPSNGLQPDVSGPGQPFAGHAPNNAPQEFVNQQQGGGGGGHAPQQGHGGGGGGGGYEPQQSGNQWNPQGHTAPQQFNSAPPPHRENTASGQDQGFDTSGYQQPPSFN